MTQPLADQVLQTKVVNPGRNGSLFYLGFFLSTGSFGPFLYVYFSELGLTGKQVGLLATCFPVMTLLFATSLSSIADRRRWRVRIAQSALLGIAILFFFMQFPSTFSGIILILVPMALCFSPVMSIADSLIARMARRHKLNYGSMRLWGSIGFACSALTFGAIWQRVGFKPMFMVGSLLLLPVIWVTGKLEEGPARDKEDRAPVTELFRDTGLVLLLITTFLAGISNSLSMTFEGIYVRSLGGGNFLIGMMTAFAAFAELPTMHYSQRIAQRLHGPNPIILAYGLMASAYLGYVLFPNPMIMPIFSVLKGLGFGLFLTNTVRIINERAPEAWSSTAQSFMTVGMFGLAPLVAGPLGGLIHDVFSPAAVFVLGILALGLAAAVLGLSSARGQLK